MLKGHDIICFSSVDWDFIWQQHQAIASTFAKNNNCVLFIENTGVRAPKITDLPRLKKRISNWLRSVKGFRKEADNLYIHSPIILPFPYSRIARWINRYFLITTIKRWMGVLEFYDPIIIAFLPTPIVLELQKAIPHKAFIYYCTDNLSATSKSARKVLRYEKKVIEEADAVFAMSKEMFEYCRAYNTNVTRIPMGIDVEVFSHSQATYKRPAEIEKIKNRIIGFVGGVRNSIDQELVIFLADKFRDYMFVFVGPIQTDISRLNGIGNIIFAGQKDHKELPSYIRHFDACIIPYVKDDYTDNISPGKLNEYLIMGKPVISTNLREVEVFDKENDGVLYMANNPDNFADSITRAISEDSDLLRKKRKEIAFSNSWQKKIEEMSDIIESAIRKKERDNIINWQAKLLGIYKILQRRMFRTIALLLVAYFLIFHTPFMWFLAKPLNISQAPEKADAIVVFGGGVGETGSPGKSTMERARFSVELYNSGFSKNIIYSSGYTYRYNDAENMKLFAMSMGIPESSIILEKKANSTYENIKYTSQILRSKNMRKVLLVSSPYNMKRAKLVFNHIAKDISVVYVPVPNPEFYNRGKKVYLYQIDAILHEYLGIVYYLFKRYI